MKLLRNAVPKIAFVALAVTLFARVADAHPLKAGALDPIFGTGGRVLMFLADTDVIRVVVQRDGRILVGGNVFEGSNRTLFLTRYLTTGELDTSFGQAGLALTEFPVLSGAYVADIAILPDDKIVAAAGSFVTRHHPDGTPDASFGAEGIVTLDKPLKWSRIAVTGDGGLLIAGTTPQFRFGVTKLTSSGVRDNSFGSAGTVEVGFFGSFDWCFGVAVQSDGRVILAGEASRGAPYYSDFAAVRLLQNGALDLDFGLNGKVTVDFDCYPYAATAATVLPDGRILLSGRAGLQDWGLAFGLVRLNADGSLDRRFGADQTGKVTTRLLAAPDQAFAMEVDRNGRILLAGKATGPQVIIKEFFAVARYKQNGRPDSTFGTDGWTVFDFGGDQDYAHSLAIQPDGRIVVAGRAHLGTTFGALARLLDRPGH